MAHFLVQPLLRDEITTAQQQDPNIMKLIDRVQNGVLSGFSVYDAILRYGPQLCVPTRDDLRNYIMKEAHTSAYTIHPGANKMYQDLRLQYWWNGMRRNISDFVTRCLMCQQVKIEHQRPAGKIQPLEILVWKWEEVTMDFVVKLPTTTGGYDSIWVVVDCLTKSAHFLPVKMGYTVRDYAKLFLQEIVRLHGVPIVITSERGPQFTSRF